MRYGTGYRPPAARANLTLYPSMTLAANPSTMVASATHTGGGWYTATWGANSLSGRAVENAAVLTAPLQDVLGTQLSTGLSNGDACVYGLDIDRALTTDLCVAVALVNNGVVASITQAMGMDLHNAAGTVTMQNHLTPLAATFAGSTGSVSGAPRRLWVRVGPGPTFMSTARSIVGAATNASLTILTELGNTVSLSHAPTHIAVMLGRVAGSGGAGSEVVRVRPWTFIRRISDIIEAI